MAGPIKSNWSSGKPIGNGITWVDSYLTTVTPSNPSGFTILYSGIQYAVQTNGKVTYKATADGRQFNTLQEADDAGYLSNTATTNALKIKLSNNLTTSTTNILNGSQEPSPYFTGTLPKSQKQPAPTDPTKKAAGVADPGPESGDQGGTNIDEQPIPDSQSLYTKDTNYENLFYPEDIGKTPNQDYVYIAQYRYKNADFLGLGSNQADPGKILGGALSTFTDRAYIQETPLGSVTLPMVNNLSETNQTGWGSDNLSSIAAAMMAGGAKSVTDIGEGNLIGAGGELTSTAAKLLTDPGVSGRLKTYLTTKAAAGIIGKIGLQINPEAYITRATGTIPNPNLELLFNGPKLRSFELAFKLTPRSPSEAKSIRKIIKFFKKGMAPRRASESEQSFFLGTPNVFKVEFRSKGNKIRSLVTYKTCALVTCQVSYTPDGFYAAYEDPSTGSQPIAVTLQLGFAELTPVYNDQYNLNSDDVGPDDFSLEYQSLPNQNLKETKVDGVSTTPQAKRPVIGGEADTIQRLTQEGGTSNIERYQAAQKAGFKGTFQQWLTKYQK